MKKRVISMMLAVVVLLGICVQNPINVPAATNEVKSMYSVNEHETVESGKTFYVGDLVKVRISAKNSSDVSELWMASEVDAAYVSNHPEVITVQENGYAETKEPGEATVTVSYQGLTTNITFTVLERGELSGDIKLTIREWEAAAKRFEKKIPSKITVENGYKLLKAMKTYSRVMEGYVNGRNFNVEETEDPLVVPAATCFNRACMVMDRYIERHHPMHQKKYWTGGKYTCYRVSTNQDQITLTFKKRLTKQAILAVYFHNVRNQMYGDATDLPLCVKTKGKKKDCFEAHFVLDPYKTGESGYGGTAVIKAGSKKIIIKPTEVLKKINGKYKWVKKKGLKLEKGRTYRLWMEPMYGEATEYIKIE